MLHVICDVNVMYFALCQNFKAFLSQFALENVGNRTKTVLVTLIQGIGVKY